MGKTIAHFWPDFGFWLGDLEDTRDQTRITYSRQFLSWMGLMVFLLKLGSRRHPCVCRGDDGDQTPESLNALFCSGLPNPASHLIPKAGLLLGLGSWIQ
jgi:hypothetical protein